MSKAEDRALERFPVHEGASKEWIEIHLKGVCAEYIKGYEQAEQDFLNDDNLLVAIGDAYVDWIDGGINTNDANPADYIREHIHKQ